MIKKKFGCISLQRYHHGRPFGGPSLTWKNSRIILQGDNINHHKCKSASLWNWFCNVLVFSVHLLMFIARWQTMVDRGELTKHSKWYWRNKLKLSFNLVPSQKCWCALVTGFIALVSL